MKTETITAVEGDSVDLICFRRFGVHGMEEIVLDANPGLAAIGPILPLGTRVVIPVPEVKDRALSDRLWD